MKIWRRDIGSARAIAIIASAFVISLLAITIVWQMPTSSLSYSDISTANNVAAVLKPIPPPITHIRTPDPLRAIYITACTASGKKSREKVLSIMADTEINALVIDIKDYSGTLAYASTSMQPNYGGGCRIYDLPQFIQELHEKGIYAIARITVFQDPVYAVRNPSVAVKNKDNTDIVWKDAKGLSYIDPGAPSYWDYIVKVGKEAYSIGFDELNFDYIRFPSDGDLSNVYYPWSAGKPKDEVIRSFFLYLREQLAVVNAPLSADLFGLTTSADGDLGIGQKLEDALAYFDYVSPMVYPSHFAYHFNDYPKPALKPYEVVKYSMDKAVRKALNASSTPSKLRPWLQAFDLGAVYSPAMVRAQIQATYDAGLNSYMLWNAGSVYNKEALSVIPAKAGI
ncbi:MAG: putative glycoside hydrolase [Patescibacteria group bacterium]